VKSNPQHVDRRLQQLRVDGPQKGREATVARDQRPISIDGISGVRLVCRQESMNRLARRLKIGVIEAPLRELGGKSRDVQQKIPIARRRLKMLRETLEHLAARLCTAGLEEAQMLGRDAAVVRQLQLSQVPPQAPLSQ
jgi:hypothetical protein